MLVNVILTLALSRDIKSPLGEILANWRWTTLWVRYLVGYRWQSARCFGLQSTDDGAGKKCANSDHLGLGTVVRQEENWEAEQQRSDCDLKRFCIKNKIVPTQTQTSLGYERWYVESELICAFFKAHWSRIPIGPFTPSIQWQPMGSI